ncbi:MAG: YybH family protein [Aeoliella sp.]
MNYSPSFLVLMITVASSSYGNAQQVATENTDQSQIEQAAVQFVDAYNKGDAKAVTALFTDDAELLERTGERFVGREEIAAAFEGMFQQNSAAKISVAVDSIRFVTPNVAVEEGQTTWFPDGLTPTVESTYRVAHVKRDGKWLMAGVRTIEDQVLTPYESLRELEWMLGDWVDEGSDSLVMTNVRWAPNRAFLLRDFTVKSGGQTVLDGTQRIGWDARNHQFRSWVFDSEGGYVEGLWTQVGNGYVIRSSGYLQDGTAVSGTTRLDREGDDRISWSMFNRLRGDEIIPDVDLKIVRKPPEPTAAAE